MATINILDKTTIDQIAAGEVIERPLNVVKELVENSIDAKASNITVEVKDGGTTFIRVTDDGEGIDKTQVKKAFYSHATSKISDAKDLLSISFLGFRGEALATICAVSQIELITKTPGELLGIRYIIEGSEEISYEEIGAPNGTTFIVKNIFYNVPARKKFLKSNQTENSYISDLMEHIALSHPEISFKFISNGKIVFSTSGNKDLKEVIYRIYGKDTSSRLIPVNIEDSGFSVYGYIGKPEITRANRNFESFFMNGRYVQCPAISKAVEEGYKSYLMQHKFPFCILHFTLDPSEIDVNVHPSKMEIRLHNQEEICNTIIQSVYDCVSANDLIPEVTFENLKLKDVPKAVLRPEPFEKERIKKDPLIVPVVDKAGVELAKVNINNKVYETIEKIDVDIPVTADEKQIDLFEDKFLTKEAKNNYHVLGQLFKTYWLIEFEDKLFILDQHAAHEKIKYERLLKNFKEKSIFTQAIVPPAIVELSSKEISLFNEYENVFKQLGFEIEDFGLGAIAIRGVPTDLYGTDAVSLFRQIIDELIENPLKGDFEVILNKLASMACKSAVKGNNELSFEEVSTLLDELLLLDNPYNCPHGRPTIVSMSKYEIEKKFKRIVD